MSSAIIAKLQKNQLKYGALLSYVQMALGIVIGLLYTPYMIRMLGKNEYGLYSTVSSTISMLTILNFGLNTGYIRYFAKYKVENNNEAIERLNGLYMVIFSILGFIVLALGVVVSFNLDWIFSNGLSSAEYITARILAIITTLNLAISFPASIFSTIISAHEKFIALKLFAMIRTIFTPIVMIPMLYYGYKSVAMVTITVLLSVFVDFCYYFYCKITLNVKFRFGNLDKTILKSLFAYTFFIALNSIFDQLSWNTDKCILARFNGTAMVAIYSVAYSLIMFFMSISSSVSGVFTPKIHTIVNQFKNNINGLNSELTTLFIKIGRIQFLIVSLILSGFCFFGKEFIHFWVGNGYEDSYFITVLFMASLLIPLIQNLGIEIQRALNKHQFRSLVYLITQIGHLILSVLLCQKYGALGCAFGNFIALVIGPGIVINVFYHKKCYIDIIAFWKNILKMCIGLLMPILIMTWLKQHIEFNVISNFIYGVIGYTILYSISMWFCSMNSYEKSLIPVLRKFAK